MPLTTNKKCKKKRKKVALFAAKKKNKSLLAANLCLRLAKKRQHSIRSESETGSSDWNVAGPRGASWRERERDQRGADYHSVVALMTKNE